MQLKSFPCPNAGFWHNTEDNLLHDYEQCIRGCPQHVDLNPCWAETEHPCLQRTTSSQAAMGWKWSNQMSWRTKWCIIQMDYINHGSKGLTKCGNRCCSLGHCIYSKLSHTLILDNDGCSNNIIDISSGVVKEKHPGSMEQNDGQTCLQNIQGLRLATSSILDVSAVRPWLEQTNFHVYTWETETTNCALNNESCLMMIVWARRANLLWTNTNCTPYTKQLKATGKNVHLILLTITSRQEYQAFIGSFGTKQKQQTES